jgi:hypothetical protein
LWREHNWGSTSQNWARHGKTCIAGPGRRSPGIFRLFAIGELIGDKPLERDPRTASFQLVVVRVRAARRLVYSRGSILSRSGRAPGGGSCGGSSYQDIRTRRMNGKNLNHERRSLEDIVVVSYRSFGFAHSFPKMDGDARSESPVSDLPVSSGKGLGECSCVPVSPVLHRT